MQTTYRLDRRFVLASVGVQMIVAGVVAMLAFWVWGPLGVLTALLLLNALRVLIAPPVVARTNPQEAKLGGPGSTKPVHVAWKNVDDVGIEAGRLVFDLEGDTSLVFSLAHLGQRAETFVRDVYDRLNAANGYRRFDPTA